MEIMSFRPRNRVKTKNKRFSPKIEEFLPSKSSEDQKKKGFHRNLGLSSARICGI